MNAHDPFEQRLRRQPLRQVPPAWREEILAQAQPAAGVNRSCAPASELPFAAALWLRLRELLWPCPQAWAGLAAVWAVMLAVSFATSEKAVSVQARWPEPPSREMRQMLRQQRQMLAELSGTAESVEASRPGSASPPPRSQYRSQFRNA